MKTHLSQPTQSSVLYTAFLENFTTFKAFLSKPNCSRTFLLSCKRRVLIFVPSLNRQNLSSHWMETMFFTPEFKVLKMKSVGILPEHGTANGTRCLMCRSWLPTYCY